MKNDEQKVLAELVQTVVTLDRGMDAMYMLLMKHDEVLSEMKDRVENLEKLLHVSKGGLIQ
tara:strand:+ start:358 stop:540 length:183 start_codon:yes stop_codon:yes gene_type:complete